MLGRKPNNKLQWTTNCLVYLLFALSIGFCHAQVKPFSYQDVVGLWKQANKSVVMGMIADHGISFLPTDEKLNALKPASSKAEDAEALKTFRQFLKRQFKTGTRVRVEGFTAREGVSNQDAMRFGGLVADACVDAKMGADLYGMAVDAYSHESDGKKKPLNPNASYIIISGVIKKQTDQSNEPKSQFVVEYHFLFWDCRGDKDRRVPLAKGSSGIVKANLLNSSTAAEVTKKLQENLKKALNVNEL